MSDIFDAMLSIMLAVVIGSITKFIMFPINITAKINIGCKTAPEATCPVAIIKDIRIGTKQFINPTKFDIVFFMLSIITAKFAIIIVIISMYSTK